MVKDLKNQDSARAMGLRLISIVFSLLFFIFIYKYFTIETPYPERAFNISIFFLSISVITNFFSLKYKKRSLTEIIPKKHKLLEAIEKQKNKGLTMSRPTYEELTSEISNLNSLIEKETDPKILEQLKNELLLVEEVLADTINKGRP